MTERLILIIALSIIYYHVSGLSTTNILRLTCWNTRSILSPICTCDSCHYKIPVSLQLPIISFVFCKGKCKNCGVRLPMFPLLLELILFIGMLTLSAILKFSFLGISFSYMFYEIVRVFVICTKGKRKQNFSKQFLIAIISMIPFYLSSLFVALLYKTI